MEEFSEECSLLVSSCLVRLIQIILGRAWTVGTASGKGVGMGLYKRCRGLDSCRCRLSTLFTNDGQGSLILLQYFLITVLLADTSRSNRDLGTISHK